MPENKNIIRTYVHPTFYFTHSGIVSSENNCSCSPLRYVINDFRIFIKVCNNNNNNNVESTSTNGQNYS